jgi:hypothetical protein
MPNPDGSPTTEELTVAHVRGGAATNEHQRDVGEIIELGRATYGIDNFDADSQTFADKMGPRTQEAMAVFRQFDNPHKLVKHFADRPAELEALSKLPTTRMMTEIARIEGRESPYGHAVTRSDPLWKSQAKGGKGLMNDADFTRSADAMSDADFDRQLRMRRQARTERRGNWR